MSTPIPTNRASFDLGDVAYATNGTIRLYGPRHKEAVGVTSDSRAVVPNGIFVALRGESHDGHSFLAKAIENGASIVVVEKGRADDIPNTVSVVEVEDTLVAWGGLAGAWLTRWRSTSMDGRVVAVTGSAGKTTTKEIIAALLGEIGPTHYTAGNLNNRIGVPAVIFGLESMHRFCVLEMGMSLRGELDAICSFARPDVAVVVNVGVAHAQGVGGRDGVMHEKGAVYRALDKFGIAIVNADDAYVRRAARLARVRKVETFGRGDVRTRPRGSFASDFAHEPSLPPMSIGTLPPMSIPPAEIVASAPPHYQLVSREGSIVTILCAGRDVTVDFPIPGEAAAIDLCAALAAQEAVSRTLLSPGQIEQALAKLSLAGRGAVKRIRDHILVIDDTYNANPASMRSSLSTLQELAGTRRKVAVLGEMKELGALAEPEHEALGEDIAQAGVALAIGCGGLIDLALDAAARLGVEVIRAPNTDEAAKIARERIAPNDVVLVKASRSVGAEKVVAALD
jgi:UDP-N-acetylmuramoyl-tripeptide--D-alanyl-D-alanine ligase